MDAIVQKNFNRAKPFYPLVVNYLITLYGFVELVSRHAVRMGVTLVEPGETHEGPSELALPGELVSTERILEFYADPRNRALTPLIAPLKLRSEVDMAVEVDVEELASELYENHHYVLPWTLIAAGSLLISAWEATKHFSDRSPRWEFLRHCRNAAGHGGRFNFLHGEPVRDARWRSLAVTADLAGCPLFKGYGAEGLLSPGDPLLLLWDIEQAVPELGPDLSWY